MKTFNIGYSNDSLFEVEKNDQISSHWLKLIESKKHIVRKVTMEKSDFMTPHDIEGLDVLQLGGRKVDISTLENSERLSLIVRHGVGYDKVDVDACTKKAILLANTPDGVRRAMASACLTFILACAHDLMQKQELIKKFTYPGDRSVLASCGTGLTGKTLGIIGCGNIGQEVFKLARPFDMNFITYDPYVKQKEIDKLGIQKVTLDTLMKESDFVCLCVLLNEETIGLVGTNELNLMKSTAFFINISRGPIVDEAALIEVLGNQKIKGAALDVFSEEPLGINNPLLKFDNVIATPHNIGVTDELHINCGIATMNAAIRVSKGEFPDFVINKEVMKDPRLIDKLEKYKKQFL